MDKAEFLSKVAPSHFQISKFESFTRQVNGWGFKRITQGPDINSYYHELFLRDMPHLIQWMKRTTSSGSGRRKIRGDPKDEPDFYQISKLYPIPDYYGENDGQVVRATRRLDNPGAKEGSKLKKSNETLKLLNTSTSTSNQPMPSPIQIKQRATIGKSEKHDKKANISSCSSSVPHRHEHRYIASSHSYHSATDAFVNHSHHEGPGQYSNDVTHVQNYWRSNGNNMPDPYYHYQGHNLHPPSSHHYSSHNQTPPHRQHESCDGQYVDFKPVEGTIGDRESFCWDDAEYVRQYHCRSNSNKHHKCSDSKQTANNNDCLKDFVYPDSSVLVSGSDSSNENVHDFLDNYQDDKRSKANHSNERTLSSNQVKKKSINIGGIKNISPLIKSESTSFPSPITYPLPHRPNTAEVEALYGSGINELSEPSLWTFI